MGMTRKQQAGCEAAAGNGSAWGLEKCRHRPLSFCGMRLHWRGNRGWSVSVASEWGCCPCLCLCPSVSNFPRKPQPGPTPSATLGRGKCPAPGWTPTTPSPSQTRQKRVETTMRVSSGQCPCRHPQTRKDWATTRSDSNEHSWESCDTGPVCIDSNLPQTTAELNKSFESRLQWQVAESAPEKRSPIAGQAATPGRTAGRGLARAAGTRGPNGVRGRTGQALGPGRVSKPVRPPTRHVPSPADPTLPWRYLIPHACTPASLLLFPPAVMC